MRSLARSAALPCLLALGACATAPGTPLSLEDMAADLAAHDVVFLGEEHDNDVGHLQHLQLLKLLHAARGTVVLSMEMFERDVQATLDAYLAGEIDEGEFLAASRPWPRYRRHYRPLVEYAKAQGLPVVAANAPRPLALKVAAEGVDAVAGDPLVARTTTAPRDAYWVAFQAAMEGHAGVDDSTVYRFYQSQCLKDDTMAESILGAILAADVDPLVVHVAGKFHSDDGLGVPARVAQRAPSLDIAVVSMDTGANAFRTGDGRFLLRVPPQPEIEEVAVRAPGGDATADPAGDPAAGDPAAGEADAGDADGRPALGFMPSYDDGVLGVLIDMLVEDGPAERAGLAEGDVIVRIGERTVDSVADYMTVLADLTVGQRVEVTVQRGDATKTFDVTVGRRSH